MDRTFLAPVSLRSDRGDARPRAIRAWTVLLAGAAGVVIAQVQQGYFGTEILLAVLAGVLILAPVGIRWWQGRFDLFEPMNLVAAIYFLYFAFAPIYRLSTGDLSQWHRTFVGLYTPALLAVMVAVLAMWCGYALPVGRRWGARLMAPMPLGPAGLAVLRRSGWVLVFSAFCGIMLWTYVAGLSPTRFLLPGLVTAPGSGAGGGTDVPYFFAVIEWFVPGFLLLVVSGGLRSRVLQALLWVAIVVIFVSATFRFRLFIFFVATITVYYLRRDRRPGALVLLGGSGLLLLAAGWVSLMRIYFFSYGTQGTSNLSMERILKASISDTWIFESFAAVMHLVPRFEPHVYTRPLTYVFILPFPRALWPDKPLPTWLQTISDAIGTPAVVGAGPAVPHFGEFYMAFGWVGIAVGMLIFGILTRMLWAFFRADPRDPARQVIFAIANIWLFEVIIRGYLPQIIKEFCLFILPAVVALLLARRAERRRLSRARG